MHELLLELTQAEAVPPLLARLPLDEGALIAAFSPRNEALLWVAKTAHGVSACRRLRAEAGALERLAPLAAQLNLPRALAWREGGAGVEQHACLVQSALAGKRRPCGWNPERPWAGLPSALGVAANWLHRFQQLADVRALGLGPERLAELGEQRPSSPSLPDLGEYGELLAALPRMPAPGGAARAVAVHGDFWMGNLLWQGAMRVGVVDWSGLSVGSAIEDLLTFTANLPCLSGGRAWPRLTSWQALWFSPGRPRDLLHACAAAAGYSDGDARYAFYHFLAKRMRWELGLGLQGRSLEDRRRAGLEWAAIVAWLAKHRFPDPFLPIPA